jgi:S-DNA-T family DNA segregation ATPase FtsK/SpoIIIE
MTTQQLIEAQADQIEAVLVRHGLDGARVAGGRVAPHFVRYEVQTDQLAVMRGLADEVALALHVPACRIYHRDGNVYVKVPRADAATLRLEDLYRRLTTEGPRGPQTIPPVTAVLGLGTSASLSAGLDGVPLLVQLPKVGPLLIAGEPGAGKTSLARTIVASLAMHNPPRSLQLALVGEGLRSFAGLPHLMEPVMAESATTILDVTAVTAVRDATRHADSHLVLVIDDLDKLQAREQAVLKLALRQGSPARVHVVATVENPSAMQVDAGYFPVQVLGRGAETPTEMPLFCRGDFFVMAKGQVSRMQAAFIEAEEMQSLAESKQADARPLRLIRGG